MDPRLELPPVPAGYDTRTPTHGDARAVWDVVAGCERAELGKAEVELEDIVSDWRRPGADPEQDGVFVVDADGIPAGYAELLFGRAEGNVLPPHRGRGIGAWLAAWIEARARATATPTVRQVVPAVARDRLELLAAAGYEVSDTAWSLAIGLDALGERPALPSGVEVRDFRPGTDDAATFQLVEDSFAHWPNRQANTLGGWRALTVERAGFEPWLLPLLWRGEELVGAAYCIDVPADDLGWVQQLAVREAERGQGLGTQLLHEAYGRFAERGRSRGGLATDSRTGALDLYLRFGMHVEREFIGHRLDVS